MTKQLFAWDELSNEIEIRDPKELEASNAEGGWEYERTEPNGVIVRTTGRHVALEVWAEDVNEADAMFSTIRYYVECNEE